MAERRTDKAGMWVRVPPCDFRLGPLTTPEPLVGFAEADHGQHPAEKHMVFLVLQGTNEAKGPEDPKDQKEDPKGSLL